jgi:drug/metabolite transporter (DMT)-like permease
MNKEKLGTAEMIVAMLLSGSIGLFVLKSGQLAGNVVFFRCALASLCLLPLCFLCGYLKKEHLTLAKLSMMVVSGLLLIFNWVLLFKAFPVTSISLATIVYHVNPFIILGLGALLLKQSFPASDAVWTGLAFVGLLVIVGADQAAHTGDQLWGLALVLAATSLYSCSVLVTKRLTGTPPLLIVMVQMLAGTLAVLPFTASPGTGVSAGQWPFIVALGLVHTVLLYWLVYSAMAKISLSMVAILSFLYPVSTVVIDYIFFDHVITLQQGLGAVLILTATVGVKLHWKIPLRLRASSTPGATPAKSPAER